MAQLLSTTISGTLNVTTTVTVGNSAVNPSGVAVGNSTVTAAGLNLTAQNSISVGVYGSLTTALGNSTITTAPYITVQNSTTQANLTSASLIIGSTTANTLGVFTPLVTANVTGSYANLSGQVNAATLYLQTSANVGGNVQLTTSTLTLTGNSTTRPTINVTTSGTTSGLVGGNNTITGTPSISLQNSVSIAAITSLSTTLGNSTVTSAPAVLLQNSTSQANLTSATLTIGTSVVNSTAIAMGTANVTTLNVGTAYVTTALQAAYANVTGQVNTATFFATTSANVGGNVQLTTSTLTLTGNSTTVPTINVTTSATTAGLVGGNSTITGTPTVSLQNSVSIAAITSLSTTLGNTTVTSAPSISLQNSTSIGVLNSLSATMGNSTVTTAPLVRLQNSTSQANLTSATLTIGTTIANASAVTMDQLGIGTTTMTNGPIFWSPSTSLQYNFIQQGTNTYAGNPFGFYINPNMNGTGATTTMTGLSAVPIFTPQATATVGNLYAFVGAAYLNSSIMSTNLTAIRGYWQLAATAISNTVTSAYAFYADVPNISATSNAIVTSSYSYYAGNIAKGANATQSIGTAYAYYGAQGTGSATNSWNLYMAGAASNYMLGGLFVGATTLPADLTTNTVQLHAGLFKSASMTTASTASGTAVTIFAIPANATGVYLIQATLSAVNDVPNYSAIGLLITNGTSYKYTALNTATLMAVAVSGSNLQATQTSGAAKVITATATRFA